MTNTLMSCRHSIDLRAPAGRRLTPDVRPIADRFRDDLDDFVALPG